MPDGRNWPVAAKYIEGDNRQLSGAIDNKCYRSRAARNEPWPTAASPTPRAICPERRLGAGRFRDGATRLPAHSFRATTGLITSFGGRILVKTFTALSSLSTVVSRMQSSSKALLVTPAALHT